MACEKFCYHNAKKYGKSKQGTQRWHCKTCARTTAEQPPASRVYQDPDTDQPDTVTKSVTVETEKRQSPWTVEEVADAFGVDLSEYTVDTRRASVWDGWEKDAEGVAWNAAQYATRVTFKAKDQVLKTLSEIEPVRLPRPVVTKRHRPETGARRFAFLGDMQVGYRWRCQKLTPYHDRRAIDAAIQVLQVAKVDTIIQGGDLLDLPEFSEKYTPDNDVRGTTNPAIREAAYIMHRLASITDTVALEGNHEERLRRSMRAGPFQGLERADGAQVLSVPFLLGLEEMGVEYYGGDTPRYSDAAYYPSDTVRVIHGEASSKAAASKARSAFRSHTVQFHGHHFLAEEHTHLGARGAKEHWLFVQVPCLCNSELLPKGGGAPNWQQGMVLADVYGDTMSVQYIPIRDGVDLYEGKLYHGVDYEGELSK
jgi:hypothetical protein